MEEKTLSIKQGHRWLLEHPLDYADGSQSLAPYTRHHEWSGQEFLTVVFAVDR